MKQRDEVEKYRQQMRTAILRLLPELLNVEDDALQLTGYLAGVLEVAVGLSVQIWGKQKAPHFLSKYINGLLENDR